MAFLKTISFATCFVALGVGSAFAQAPFTIRQPPDGSTTHESKVKIEIPRGSIRPGGFVTLYIDDKFRVALSPNADTTKPFTYYWNIKDEDVADGEHTIKATLAEPASQGSDAVNEVATSEVKVNIANKIKSTQSVLLRYKFRENENMEYRRDSRAYVVGAESAAGKATGDIELNEARAKLLVGVDDLRPNEDIALVRNKMTALTVLGQQQEFTLPIERLSGTIYQEVNSRGAVQPDATFGVIDTFAEFAALGLAVENTMALPVMPATPVVVGSTWTTPGQSLELPGLPAFAQPGVKMDNKFESMEWEGRYQTVKIRQSYKGSPVKKLYFGTLLITQPTITIDKVIYFANKSGKLIRTVRTLTIQGRTSSPLPTNTQPTDPNAGGQAGPNGYGGRGTPAGAPPGSPGGFSGGAPAQGRGGPPPGSPGRPGANGGYGNGQLGEADRPITIKNLTETEYLGDAK